MFFYHNHKTSMQFTPGAATKCLQFLQSRTRVGLNALLCGGLLASTTVFASGSCVNFIADTNGITVPVQVEGKDSRALFATNDIGVFVKSARTDDQYTGASSPLHTINAAISSALVQELGLQTYTDPRLRVTQPSGNNSLFTYTRDVPVMLFGADAKVGRMIVVESDEYDLSLSMAVFREAILHLDFPGTQACILESGAMDLRALNNMELSRDMFGNPAILVTINGNKKTWLKFSPNYAGGILLDRAKAEAMNLDIGSVEVVFNDEDRSSRYSSILNSVTLGPYELANVPVVFPAETEHVIARSQATNLHRIQHRVVTHGTIGYEALRHFLFTFNLEESRMNISTQ